MDGLTTGILSGDRARRPVAVREAVRLCANRPPSAIGVFRTGHRWTSSAARQRWRRYTRRGLRVFLQSHGAMSQHEDESLGERSAQLGVLVNAALVAVKLVAGVVGNSYALVADAVESTADIFSSLVVLGGLRLARREADEEFPFGYGRAETLAAAVVALMLIGTAIGIAVEAVREINTPHHAPAAWTLLVLVLVMGVKWAIARHVARAGRQIDSRAVQADAWHHLGDAVTSAAAFIGISVALWKGPGWEPADDYAALFASAIILLNGALMLRGALLDLMDRRPEAELEQRVRAVAGAVPGVRAIEKLRMRRSGLKHFVDIHVQADGRLPLEEAHRLGGRVKGTLLRELSAVGGVLVHMEPYLAESVGVEEAPAQS